MGLKSLFWIVGRNKILYKQKYHTFKSIHYKLYTKNISINGSYLNKNSLIGLFNYNTNKTKLIKNNNKTNNNTKDNKK